MNDTYIQVKGVWVYDYRAVDKHGATLDFMLPELRDEATATKFFKLSIEDNGWLEKVVIDKTALIMRD